MSCDSKVLRSCDHFGINITSRIFLLITLLNSEIFTKKSKKIEKNQCRLVATNGLIVTAGFSNEGPFGSLFHEKY